jgi:hypothetical protein
MSDEADLANDRAQQELERALALARAPVKAVVSNGTCFYCLEAIEGERRFCDSDCLSDYEREKRLRARQGRQ